MRRASRISGEPGCQVNPFLGEKSVRGKGYAEQEEPQGQRTRTPPGKRRPEPPFRPPRQSQEKGGSSQQQVGIRPHRSQHRQHKQDEDRQVADEEHTARGRHLPKSQEGEPLTGVGPLHRAKIQRRDRILFLSPSARSSPAIHGSGAGAATAYSTNIASSHIS